MILSPNHLPPNHELSQFICCCIKLVAVIKHCRVADWQSPVLGTMPNDDLSAQQNQKMLSKNSESVLEMKVKKWEFGKDLETKLKDASSYSTSSANKKLNKNR